jgi:hypothetical protein
MHFHSILLLSALSAIATSIPHQRRDDKVQVGDVLDKDEKPLRFQPNPPKLDFSYNGQIYADEVCKGITPHQLKASKARFNTTVACIFYE